MRWSGGISEFDSKLRMKKDDLLRARRGESILIANHVSMCPHRLHPYSLRHWGARFWSETLLWEDSLDSHWASLDVIATDHASMEFQVGQIKELLTGRGRLRLEHHLGAAYNTAAVHGEGQHGRRPAGVN